MEKRVITYLMLIVALALGMASCSEHDDIVDTNPLHDDIVGSFYKLYDVNGSIDGVISKTSLPHEYTRIVEVYHFGEDGTGLWNRYFFDDESGEPFADLGGAAAVSDDSNTQRKPMALSASHSTMPMLRRMPLSTPRLVG